MVSFPLGALPAGARVETATLRVYQNAARSGAPYELLGDVLVDHVSYSAFSPGPALWSERRGYTGVLASWYRPGTWHELDVTAEARDELQLYGSGRLQFRLYHQADTTGNSSTDQDGWSMGEEPGFAPQLVLTYR